MVDVCSLLMIPSRGRKFTWTTNRKAGHVAVVLDRSFCNKAWLSVCGDSSQIVLTSTMSDHAPILVVAEAVKRLENVPFRLQRFWLEHPNFLHIVQESWKEWISGSSMFVLAQKLKRLKPIIRAWAKENYPNFEEQVHSSKKELQAVQEEIERVGMSDLLFYRELVAKNNYNVAVDNFEKLWAEKSRLNRKVYGDKCSKFFHLSTKIRRAKNKICSLETADRHVLMDQEQIKNYVEYYKNFHKAMEVVEHKELLNCIPRVLEDVDNFRSDSVPRDSEIRAVVWQLDPDCSWAKRVDGASALEKFRPLCMGNFFYKILSKIMALRLEVVLPKLISEEQGVFQKGKVIHDNIVIASELANLMSAASRGGGMGLKIDIQKAYDTISWDFIFKVMIKFGFSERWIKWLGCLLSSTRLSVLVNGGPVGFFGVERGRAAPRCQAIVEVFHTRYLGVEISKGRVKRDMLLPVMDRVRNKMAGWKGKLLSMAGRVELVKSVVSISWDNLCKPKAEGGLGIRRLRDVNMAMLCKLTWKIRNDKLLSSTFLRHKYVNKWGNLQSGYKASSIWPGIRKMWSFVKEKEH
ncbi:uncharacterized protein LOC122650056 [Telopea speciosissima]|uniref:uncharacterized protein LOC122650056 n=1 Tax=Telopea speciosissima TaxID=54955 RepID=UPI001CC5156B|nr:uncharacterized protein LOC122650056 [Telopea speciosissima]